MYKWLAFVPLCNAALCICIVLLLLSKVTLKIDYFSCSYHIHNTYPKSDMETVNSLGFQWNSSVILNKYMFISLDVAPV